MILSLLLLPLASACTVLQLPSFSMPAGHAQAYAEQLFINGEFEDALFEYEHIYKTALSPEDRNQALYGLACSQMMLAQTEDQLIEAISNLQKWDATKGSASFVENRHLLMLALKQQSGLMEKREKGLLKQENQKNALIANQQLKIAQMASKIDKLQNHIEKLQNQIAELEAIDKNAQENRKPL